MTGSLLWPWGGRLKWRSREGHWDQDEERQRSAKDGVCVGAIKVGVGEDGALMPWEVGWGRLGEAAPRSRGGWHGLPEAEEEKHLCVYFPRHEKIFPGVSPKVAFWKH